MISEWTVAAILILPAIGFAAKGSSLLVDYSILVYVFNREIRRVVDWYEGSFNPFSPISLTPLIVLCLLLLPHRGAPVVLGIEWLRKGPKPWP